MGGSFRLAGYLLPSFHSYSAGKSSDGVYGWLYSAYQGRSTYSLPHPPTQSYLQLPAGTHSVIILDQDMADIFSEKAELQSMPLPDGTALYVLRETTAPIDGLVLENDRWYPSYGRTLKMSDKHVEANNGHNFNFRRAQK